ncbi:unnamed protein product [Polarella glacialis]|uniref:Uncharacterized protein n=1 Tax=Polarella glacialis TaxID=89957 RepID=A0A813FSJ3_POLGL|nr:unnamed protein product [Polarella glacialis]CAE8710794.1 unnamed protein product [Polarella glacialis]
MLQTELKRAPMPQLSCVITVYVKAVRMWQKLNWHVLSCSLGVLNIMTTITTITVTSAITSNTSRWFCCCCFLLLSLWTYCCPTVAMKVTRTRDSFHVDCV